jgi:hypothetical protein
MNDAKIDQIVTTNGSAQEQARERAKIKPMMMELIKKAVPRRLFDQDKEKLEYISFRITRELYTHLQYRIRQYESTENSNVTPQVIIESLKKIPLDDCKCTTVPFVFKQADYALDYPTGVEQIEILMQIEKDFGINLLNWVFSV